MACTRRPLHAFHFVAQVLIDCIGAVRVMFAVVVGALCKIFRVGGGFYRAAGPQSRTIDDISGDEMSMGTGWKADVGHCNLAQGNGQREACRLAGACPLVVQRSRQGAQTARFKLSPMLISH